MSDFRKIYKNFETKIPCGENCSACCQIAGNIVLFPGEAGSLAEKVPGAAKYIRAKMVNGQSVEIIEQPCPFLKNGLCSIEGDRPLDCRLYPFDYCVFNDQIIVITSKSCPETENISVNEKRRVEKKLLGLLEKMPRGWLMSSVLFGPCGSCGKKATCELERAKGFNDKDW